MHRADQQVTLLRLLVNQRRLTREEVRRCLVRRASHMQIHHFSIARRQLDRWLNGEVKRLPHPSACRVLEAEFGHPPEQLLSFVDQPDVEPAADVRELLGLAAAQSVGWGRRQEQLGLGPLALEGLRLQVESLATEYVHRPMVPVVQGLIALRNDLFAQLVQPDPAQARDLYLLAGLSCAMLGHASGNLGFLGAAHQQVQTALVCARKAGHPTLAAWAIGVRALQCEWNGRPRDTLSLVARALKELAPARTPGTTAVWLSAVEARAWARLGHQDAATEALATAQRTADRGERDDLDKLGGILTFPRPKQRYYAAVVSRYCGDLVRTEQYARSAVTAYATGPGPRRSYGDEALAWIELALARAGRRQPDLDGAVEALRQARTATSHTQLAALSGPLRELGVISSMPKVRGSSLAVQLRGEVRQLLGQRESGLRLVG